MFFILGYGIFMNFGIWDIGNYFGIRVKLILGYGIFWTVYFEILDIAYPPKVITKTCPCNVYPLEPHFYIAKLGYAEVYLFFLFLLQNIDCGFR